MGVERQEEREVDRLPERRVKMIADIECPSDVELEREFIGWVLHNWQSEGLGTPINPEIMYSDLHRRMVNAINCAMKKNPNDCLWESWVDALPKNADDAPLEYVCNVLSSGAGLDAKSGREAYAKLQWLDFRRRVINTCSKGMAFAYGGGDVDTMRDAFDDFACLAEQLNAFIEMKGE